MRVWLDVLTPKQANLFTELQHRLNARGFKTILTTREYREVNELLELRGMKAIQVGRYGGGDFRDKLKESAKRVVNLAEVIQEQEPEVAISFSSPEAARVAFGLKIPHYCISDSPHAEAVCRLTIPFSQKLFAPWVIPLYAWRRYGINPRDIVRYRALDPIAWLRGSPKTNQKVLDSLNLDSTKPIAVIRTTEEFAAYLADRSSSVSGIATEIIARMLQVDDGNLQIVVLPRYDGQGERLRKRFGNRVIVPGHVVDAISLMQATSVFVGGGGTMTAEAALLGVPVISYYPGEPTFVERFLINYGLVERLLDPGRVGQRAVLISKSHDFGEFYRKKSARLASSMEDPLRVIVQRIFKR
jgi:predicted glycosyltransferase